MDNIFIAAFAGFIYASVFYLKSRTKHEKFDAVKYFATILWGIVLGAILEMSGVEVSEESIAQAFSQYFTLIVVTENVIKAIVRIFHK